MPLQPIAENLYHVCDWLRMGPGMWFPVRTTIATLPDGGLWVHSPLRFSDEQAAAIDALGPVRWIVAPNGFHHLSAGHAAARWPAATLLVAPEVRRKRPDLAHAGLLSDADEATFGGAFALRHVDGAARTDEWVFLHKTSGSLVVTDLLFHMHETRGWMSPLVFRLVGCHCQLAQSKMWRMAVKDRAAFAAAGRDILAWDAARLVVGHGDVLEGGATAGGVRGALEPALAWMLGG